MGPKAVSRDRFNYTTAISDSWKKQMLLNMVMIRYGDSPVFLDVGSIVNQSSIETTLNGNLSWSFPPSGDSQSVGGTAKYTDRPTITYSPLTGERFARNLMSPIPTIFILNLVNWSSPRKLFRI
jgi:hypothetical protein